MARYIDADKAVEEARLSYCKDCNSYNGIRCSACAFDDAMSYIEDAPTADVVEVPKWIDVNEKLPNKNKSVLCYCKNTSTDGGAATIGSYANGIWFLQGSIGEQHFPRHYWKVTHWQPLPEQPSEAKMDGERK